MNWINAKDSIPEENQMCLVYSRFSKGIYDDIYDDITIATFRSQKIPSMNWFELENGLTIPFIFDNEYYKDIIYWIPINDIPKPEKK